MIIVNFELNGTVRKVAIGNCGCRTEATERVVLAFPGCKVVSTATMMPRAMFELIEVE